MYITRFFFALNKPLAFYILPVDVPVDVLSSPYCPLDDGDRWPSAAIRRQLCFNIILVPFISKKANTSVYWILFEEYS
jgi:hypothetical protein